MGLKFNPLIFSGFDNSGSSGGGATPTGPAGGDLSGTYPNPSVGFVGGLSASVIVTGVNLANSATSSNTINTIVKRDGSGNFSAGTITANLTGTASGNANTALSNLASVAINTNLLPDGDFTRNLGNSTHNWGTLNIGNITGTSSINISASADINFTGGTGARFSIIPQPAVDGVIGLGKSTARWSNLHTNNITLYGSTSGNVIVKAAAVTVDHTLTLPGTQGSASTVLTNDGSGNLSWSTGSSGITQLTGDVTAGPGSGSQVATVAFVGGTSASLIASGAALANAATSANTASTIVRRDGSGSFSASTIVSTSDVTSMLSFPLGGNQSLSAGFIISPSSTFITVTGSSTISDPTTPIAAGTKDGQILIIKSLSSTGVTLKAGGNVDLPSGLDYIIVNPGTLTLIWDNALSRWTTLCASANN